MANFDDLKQTLLAKLGTVADKTKDVAANASVQAKELAGKAADKAVEVKRMAKLNIELSTAKESLKKTYTELGKLCYTNRGADPEGSMEQLFQEISLTLDTIAAKEEELAVLKAGAAEPDVEVEVEDYEAVVAETEAQAEQETDGE